MADTEMSIAELWGLIQQSNALMRKEISDELVEVRRSLNSFATKEQWSAERAMLELRLERAEQELASLERVQRELERRIAEEKQAELARKDAERDRREAEEAAAAERREDRRLNVWFKVVIPLAAIVLPIAVGLWSPLGK